MSEDLPARGIPRPHKLQGRGIHCPQPGHPRYQGRVEGEQRRHQDLGDRAEAEPQGEDRRDGHQGDGLQQEHQRHDRPFQGGIKGGDHGQPQGDSHAEGQPDERFPHGHPGGLQV